MECSSKGEKCFSAFYARVNGKSIEEQYQSAKVFADGTTGLTWRAAKGRRPVNGDFVARLYSSLWDQYMAENPHLLAKLKLASGVSDMFGQAGHQCQATELWRIRNKEN
jgi:hypothetical protein